MSQFDFVIGRRIFVMGQKGEEKKNYILRKAEQVFARKGYTSVTMKDIVDECGISRGGLYKYFGSTREIFEELLSRQKGDDVSFFTEGMGNKASALDILHEFFEKQKTEMINMQGSIRIAVYEYFLSQKNDHVKDLLEGYFNGAVALVSQTLAYGIDRGEIVPLDTEQTARHIVLVLEGLNTLAMGTPVSPKLIEEQMGLIMNMLVKAGTGGMP